MAVVIETGTGEELVRAARTVAIDVAVLDARIPPTFRDEGLQAAQRLRVESPAIGILILSTYAETPYATEVLELPPGGAAATWSRIGCRTCPSSWTRWTDSTVARH